MEPALPTFGKETEWKAVRLGGRPFFRENGRKRVKKILMIGTGGTIASEMTEAGLAPGMEGADFLRYVPAVEKLCQVDPLQVCRTKT